MNSKENQLKGLQFKAHKVSIEIKRKGLGCWESREGIVHVGELSRVEEKIEGAKNIFLFAAKTKKSI